MTLEEYARRFREAHTAELERRCILVHKFVPVAWLSLQYRQNELMAQPKIIATAPKGTAE